MAKRRSKLVNHEFKARIYYDSIAHGIPVTLIQKTGDTFNVGSGKKETTNTETNISRAITWMVTSTDRFSYDIGYLAANSNFTYGGEYQIGDRHVIISGKYLPKLITESVDDLFFIVNDSQYKTVSYYLFDGGAGGYFHLRKTQKSRVSVFKQHFASVLVINDSFES